MLLIKNPCTDPCFNLAMDEYLLKSRSEDIFTLWRNGPSVIIGRNQDALAEIDLHFLRQNNIALVRRMSGGGAVFHDLGNINFTYITPCEKAGFFDFARFADPILAALRGLGIDAQATGRNDLTVDGRKFSGNAQHLHKGRLLHHGTLLFNAAVSHMQSALRVNPSKLEGKGVASVRSRVVNLAEYCPAGMTAVDFLEYLETFILGHFDGCTEYTLSEHELQEVRDLADRKFRTDAWNLLHMGKYAMERESRFPSGLLKASFEGRDGRLAALSLSGDFFGVQDINALVAGLIGTPHTPDALEEALTRLDVAEYISGVSPADVAALFF